MTPPALVITDLWFHSPLSLRQIAAEIGLADASFDSEDHWEWVIGTAAGVELNISRTHRRPPTDVDTRVMRNDLQPIDDDLRASLVPQLLRIATGFISCGRWIYRRGNAFDLHVVEIIRA